MLSVNAADLDVELVSDGLEGGHVFRKLGKLNVNGSSHGSTKVGGARGDVTEVLIMGELDDSLNVCSGARKSVENSMDVGTLLHGNNTELILFINPHKEGLFFVVEDTSAIRPVAVQTSNF